MVSNNFINECKNGANHNRLGKIVVEDSEELYTNSDYLSSITQDSSCYVNDNIIGSIYTKALTITLLNDDDLQNKAISAQIGVKYADSTTEYMDLGKYKVSSQNNVDTATNTKITAYDYLQDNIDKPYICYIDYSSGNITLKDLYIDVCSQIDLIPVTTTFVNSDIPISANPFTNGETNRTVLKDIATIACSFITVDYTTNKIDLSWLSQSSTPDYSFSKSDYSTLKGGKVIYGPVNCLIIKNSQIDNENVTIKDQTSIDTNGENDLVLSEDYILSNADLRNQAITAIWNRVNGLTYYDYELETSVGKPFLKIGDKVEITRLDNTTFISYVLSNCFTYDGTFYSKISGKALSSQEIKTKQTKTLGQALYETQIEVDKQNHQITTLVTKEETLNEDYNGFKSQTNTTINSQNTRIDNATSTLLEFKNEVQENGVTKVQTSTGFKLDKDGLNISKTGADTNTTITENGLYVKNSNNDFQLEANSAGVIANNLTAKGYLITRPIRGERAVLNGSNLPDSVVYADFWIGDE